MVSLLKFRRVCFSSWFVCLFDVNATKMVLISSKSSLLQPSTERCTAVFHFWVHTEVEFGHLHSKSQHKQTFNSTGQLNTVCTFWEELPLTSDKNGHLCYMTMMKNVMQLFLIFKLSDCYRDVPGTWVSREKTWCWTVFWCCASRLSPCCTDRRFVGCSPLQKTPVP